jgi:hypothetical protein
LFSISCAVVRLVDLLLRRLGGFVVGRLLREQVVRGLMSAAYGHCQHQRHQVPPRGIAEFCLVSWCLLRSQAGQDSATTLLMCDLVRDRPLLRRVPVTLLDHERDFQRRHDYVVTLQVP